MGRSRMQWFQNALILGGWRRTGRSCLSPPY